MERTYPEQFKEIKKKYAKDNNLFSKLETGTAILETENELNQYLYSYGNMHYAKLEETYKKFFTET